MTLIDGAVGCASWRLDEEDDPAARTADPVKTRYDFTGGTDLTVIEPAGLRSDARRGAARLDRSGRARPVAKDSSADDFEQSVSIAVTATHDEHNPLDLQVNLRVYGGRVDTVYRIKDVADRSGFSAATLRYYEEICLLPEASRTPAGYRLYDEHTLDRLAFIARAKQLGCSLDKIAELTAAWEGGQCGPVQDRLRSLVADKLTAAQVQIVELTTFRQHRRLTRERLTDPRPSFSGEPEQGVDLLHLVDRDNSGNARMQVRPALCLLDHQSGGVELLRKQRWLLQVLRRISAGRGCGASFTRRWQSGGGFGLAVRLWCRRQLREWCRRCPRGVAPPPRGRLG